MILKFVAFTLPYIGVVLIVIFFAYCVLIWLLSSFNAFVRSIGLNASLFFFIIFIGVILKGFLIAKKIMETIIMNVVALIINYYIVFGVLSLVIACCLIFIL
jgi:hypothetical protein